MHPRSEIPCPANKTLVFCFHDTAESEDSEDEQTPADGNHGNNNDDSDDDDDGSHKSESNDEEVPATSASYKNKNQVAAGNMEDSEVVYFVESEPVILATSEENLSNEVCLM